MADTNDLTKGATIRKDNKLWFVNDAFFVSPGKGAAFYRTKLKDINTGKVVEHTFKSGEGIELIETFRRSVSFLYAEGDDFVFMDEENFEQYTLSIEIVSEDVAKYLLEGQKLIIFFAEEQPINITFPKQKLGFKVVDAPPGIKGDTATNTTRAVTLETGAEVQAPLFIKEGETIVVNVETGEYCGREN